MKIPTVRTPEHQALLGHQQDPIGKQQDWPGRATDSVHDSAIGSHNPDSVHSSNRDLDAARSSPNRERHASHIPVERLKLILVPSRQSL
jgi:hypothetical protein